MSTASSLTSELEYVSAMSSPGASTASFEDKEAVSALSPLLSEKPGSSPPRPYNTSTVHRNRRTQAAYVSYTDSITKTTCSKSMAVGYYETTEYCEDTGSNFIASTLFINLPQGESITINLRGDNYDPDTESNELTFATHLLCLRDRRNIEYDELLTSLAIVDEEIQIVRDERMNIEMTYTPTSAIPARRQTKALQASIIAMQMQLEKLSIFDEKEEKLLLRRRELAQQLERMKVLDARIEKMAAMPNFELPPEPVEDIKVHD
jgi:hypothetical protein